MYYTRAEISWRGIFKWINIADKTYYPGITRACRVWSVSKYIKSFLSQGNYRKRNFSRYESVNNIYFDRLLRVESYLFRDRDNSFATFNFRQRYLVSRRSNLLSSQIIQRNLFSTILHPCAKKTAKFLNWEFVEKSFDRFEEEIRC